LRFEGTAKIVLGAEVGEGDFIATDADGRGVLATSTDFIVGRSLESGSVNQVVEIVLFKIKQEGFSQEKFNQALMSAFLNPEVKTVLIKSTTAIKE
jgi:hypothetical protein